MRIVSRWFGSVLLGVTLMLCIGCTKADSAQKDLPATQKVVIKGRTFQLEIAADEDSRHLGLGGRESIAEDGGMLFVFPNAGYRTFVMRDCLVPIDLIYLGPTGEVLQTHKMTPEPGTPEWMLKSYNSGKRAQYAIELKGGMIEQLNIQRGERIDLPLDMLKQYVQ